MANKITFGVQPWLLSLEERYRDPSKAMGVATGLSDYDAITYGIHPGEVHLIAARTGVGKSSLAITVALNVAMRGKNVLMFSSEMSERAIIQRCVANISGINSRKLRSGNLADAEFEHVEKCALWARRLPLYIEDKIRSIDAAVDMVTGVEGELALVIFDYIQEFHPEDSKRHGGHLDHGYVSQEVAWMAKEKDVAVLSLAQLNREAARGDPDTHHVFGSDQYAQDADVVSVLYPYDPELDPSRMTLKVTKNREGEQGEIDLYFLRHISKYTDCEIKKIDLNAHLDEPWIEPREREKANGKQK